MATIPRTYKITSSSELDSITPVSGQIIALWDTDAVYYDAPVDEGHTESAVRRKISGVKVINSLDDLTPMNDIIYVYIPSNPTEYLPSTADPSDPEDKGQPLFDLRVWVGDTTTGNWVIVGTNRDDINVKTEVIATDDKFYLTGCKTTTEDISTLLKTPKIYAQIQNNKGVIHADTFDGTIAEASHADRANTADKAIGDRNGKDITDYIYAVSGNDLPSGTQLTFTHGNNNTTTVNTRDTTYPIFSDTANGIVPKTNPPVSTDDTHLVLSGSGWIDADNMHIMADSAEKDGLDQNIANTYIKDGSLTVNSGTNINTLTLTYGDSTSGTPHIKNINVPDTKYAVFDTSNDGLVPKASGTGDTNKFLRGDHTWQSAVQPSDIYQGATSSAAGVPGLVPSAQAGHTTDYLRGDGTWGAAFSQGVAGLVPAPDVSTATAAYSLKGNGQWTADIDTKNTAGATNDTTNLLYVVGARTQGSEPVTNTNQNVYIQNNKLFSNGSEVVDLSSTQTLANKSFTIDGSDYTLGTACAATAADDLTPEIPDDATFSGDGSTTTFDFDTGVVVVRIDSVTVGGTTLSDTDYSLDDTQDPNQIIFTTAPATGTDNIEVSYVAANPDYDPAAVPTNDAVISYVSNQVTAVSTEISNKADTDMIAPGYDDTATYNVGDFCTNQAQDDVKLYKCKTAVTAAETFDPAKWDEILVTSELKQINVRVPTPPSTNGTYYLSVTVNNGTYTYGWVALP